MSQKLLFAGFICLLACACSKEEQAVSSSSQSGGVISAKVEALPTSKVEAVSISSAKVNDIALASPIIEALKKYDPEFRVWKMENYPLEKAGQYPFSPKSMPYAVFGDYNGDGREDVVLAGRNKSANIVVALLSAGTGYYLVEVQNEPYYSMARENGKDIPDVANEFLLFQRKGCRYSIGDMEIIDILLKNEGFVLENIKSFSRKTAEFGGRGGTAIYQWDLSVSKFHSESFDSSTDGAVARCVSRIPFESRVFEERTVGRPPMGASFRLDVKLPSGEWAEQKPLRVADGVAYYKVYPNAELRANYSCVPPDPYGVKYWKVSETYSLSPVDGGQLDTDAAIDIPNPVISKVLQAGTSFAYYWSAPGSAVEIKKEAVFSYACQDRKTITVFTVTP